MFRKTCALFCLVVCAGLFPAITLASDIVELRSREEAAGGPGGGGERVDRVLCVDGLKIFQTIAFGVGSGSGAAVSNIQLYEMKDGKKVPATCDVNAGKKK